jgi:hypothetical protein
MFDGVPCCNLIEKKVCLRTKKANGDEAGHLEIKESVMEKPKRESQAKGKKKKSTHTCPRCNKIFGNMFGFNYHTSKSGFQFFSGSQKSSV